MKKGLLGLLVVALTMVGCQNYDDQFDDLNSKISSLATTVDGLLSVQTTVSALSTKLDNLASTALTDSDLAGILTEVAAVKKSVADLSLADDLAGIETEVADLDAEVDQILEKLNELLTANAVINQNIRITSLAELSLAEDLISTGADDPNVTINGSLVVGTTGASDISAAADVARLNAVLDKIKVVMKTVTVTTDEALTAVSLQYIQGSLDINAASGSLSAAKLTTVTEAMEINQGGALLMPLLNSVAGNILIQTAGVTITSVDFSGLTEGAARTDTNELALPEAISVKISGVLPTTVNCPKATEFVSGSTTAQTATTITVDGSTSFSLGAASFSGQVTITAKGAVTLAGVTSAKQLSITSDASVDLGGLTALASSTVISATTVNLSSVAAISAVANITASSVDIASLKTTSAGATVTLVGPTSVSAPALETAGGGIVAASATSFAAIKLATSTGTIDVANDATIEVGNLAAINDLVDFVGVKVLKLHAQEASLNYSTAVSITSLTVLGKQKSPITQNGQANDVTLTGSNTLLTELVVGGTLRQVSLDATKLTGFSSVGGSTILDLVLKNNADLATVALAHDRLDGERALGIEVVNNDKLTSLDMSTVNKIKEIEITGNASLTSIVMAGFSPAVEPTAKVTVTISGNALPGEYTSATAGTDTTPYLEAAIVDNTGIICGVKAFINYYDGAKTSGTVTATVDLDKVELYTQEENAQDVVVRTIASPAVNQALSAHIAADNNATGFGGATDAIDSAKDFALISCD